MSFEVARLLERGRAAGEGVSALDAVMGENWAILDPGRARRGRTPGLGLRIAHRADVARGLGGGLLPGRRPQAVVKMIRKGGASDVRGLRAQMAYLSRERTQPLQRSEAMLGIEVDAGQAALLERDWRMPPEGSGRADRTSHFIVSFPQEAVPASAERAGRAWAEEMFGSGHYGGDSYDYYTAFHTDRAHPHMHVVVYRRGLEHGEWLKVSQRGDMNYDRMRAVLVDVAGREGIELEATSRLARGLHDRPVPDAEYRLAAAEDREAEAPEHTHETAIRAAAAVIHFARQFAADARAIERDLPEQAAMLHAIAERLAEGRAIAIQNYGNLSPEGERQMADRLEDVTREVRGKFERLDGDVLDVADDATRMRFLRQIAELKAGTVPYLRDPGELGAFAERDDSGRFEAIVASDPVSREIKSAADDVARGVAAEFGVDPDATVERYSGAIPSKGLARQFVEAEERERAASRALSGIGPEPAEDRGAALERMRTELRSVYREGRAIVDERHAGMAERLQDRGGDDRGADDREVDRSARDEIPDGQRQRDLETLRDAKERRPDIVEAIRHDRDDEGREAAQDTVDRQARDVRPRRYVKLTAEDERILRDLERDTDDYDR